MMNILDFRGKKFVTIHHDHGICHAKRLSAAQYFSYRRIAATIDLLPPVDTPATQAAVAQCRRELIRLIYPNFAKPADRHELWNATLSELLDRSEYLLEGPPEPGEEKIGTELAAVAPEAAVTAIMQTFPAYKLYHLAMMSAWEFRALYRLTRHADNS
ncbi:MAG: hypothetical protein PHQ27_07920 [Victivallales bacterium]|nr:hypothetical protein [Victivallales bacterium]